MAFKSIERKREYAIDYYNNHKQRHKEIQRKSEKLHPRKKRTEYHRLWKKKNKHKIYEYNKKRRFK